MHLYLIQHGQAKTKEEDPDRGLTAQGIVDVERVSQHFAQLDPVISEIRHSPKLRAKETAKILGKRLRIIYKVKEYKELTPNNPVLPLAEELTNLNKDIALVGHLPHLSKLSSLLLCGDENAELIIFKNSGIVCLQKQEKKWKLQWILPPQIFAI